MSHPEFTAGLTLLTADHLWSQLHRAFNGQLQQAGRFPDATGEEVEASAQDGIALRDIRKVRAIEEEAFAVHVAAELHAFGGLYGAGF